MHFKKAFLFCLEFHQLKLLLNHRMISLWSVYKSVIGTSSFKSLVNSFVNRAPVLLLPELGSNFNFLCLCTSACKVSQDKTHIWGKYHFLLRNDQLWPGIFNLKSMAKDLAWLVPFTVGDIWLTNFTSNFIIELKEYRCFPTRFLLISEQIFFSRIFSKLDSFFWLTSSFKDFSVFLTSFTTSTTFLRHSFQVGGTCKWIGNISCILMKNKPYQ